jgi:hypothetical protein
MNKQNRKGIAGVAIGKPRFKSNGHRQPRPPLDGNQGACRNLERRSSDRNATDRKRNDEALSNRWRGRIGRRTGSVHGICFRICPKPRRRVHAGVPDFPRRNSNPRKVWRGKHSWRQLEGPPKLCGLSHRLLSAEFPLHARRDRGTFDCSQFLFARLPIMCALMLRLSSEHRVDVISFPERPSHHSPNI